MNVKSKQVAHRAPVNVPALRPQPMQYDRINVCPETGIDLATVDIAKHVHTLWPHLDEKDNAYAEARKRRDHLLHEHQARETEAGMHRVEN
jgi:hypothetical protein